MNYLLDTSALKWAYLEGSKFCRRCRYIISRNRGRVYVAEISVIEIVNALGSRVRGRQISVPQFWNSNHQFLKDVADRKIAVLPFPSSDFIACRHLLTLAGVDAGKNLDSQDAMVAYTARRLALERGEQVVLATSDQRLAKIVKELSLFKKLVKSVYWDPN